MPAAVWFGNNGTVLSVDGNDLLGSFKTFKASGSTKEVDHTGVHDVAEYSTVRHIRLSLAVDFWTPVSGSPAMSMLGKRVVVSADCADGRILAGLFNVTGADSSGDDSAGNSSLKLDSFGPWTIDGTPYGDPATWPAPPTS